VSHAPRPDVSVVVLTRGDRPTELRAALHSALAQRDVAVEIVVVANGVGADAIPALGDARVRLVTVPENLGIPGGRNVGSEHASAPLLAYLDDDATFADSGVLARSLAAFGEDPRLGVIALRIVDERGETARRHVPRLGSGRPDRSGAVTAFLGGAAVMRRAAREEVGGYAAEFRYAMEETDLALRLVDRGWSIRYDGAPAVVHPRTDPARHPGSAERTMRNRVWLAYRNLPAPLALCYVANWLVVSAVRQPRRAGDLVRGVADGWRTRPRAQRAPIRWHTVARLTRLGRPPIL
jgi:GT2 family glycosyltransferase